MNKHFVKLGLVAAMGLLGAVVTTEADAKDMVGWRVEGSGANIVPGQGYSLYNLDRGGYLGWKDRTGANLELEGKANGGVVFKRKGGDGPLKCGEVFALWVEKSHAHYGKQTFGINLTTDKDMKDDWYQWKFTGCTAGQPISLNTPVTLTNMKEDDSVVGCYRKSGLANTILLCWADDVATVRGKNYRKADVPR